MLPSSRLRVVAPIFCPTVRCARKQRLMTTVAAKMAVWGMGNYTSTTSTAVLLNPCIIFVSNKTLILTARWSSSKYSNLTPSHPHPHPSPIPIPLPSPLASATQRTMMNYDVINRTRYTQPSLTPTHAHTLMLLHKRHDSVLTPWLCSDAMILFYNKIYFIRHNSLLSRDSLLRHDSLLTPRFSNTTIIASVWVLRRSWSVQPRSPTWLFPLHLAIIQQ